MKYTRVSKNYAVLEDGSRSLDFSYGLHGLLMLPVVEVGGTLFVDITIELSCDEDVMIWYGADRDGSLRLYSDKPRWDDFIGAWIPARVSDHLYIGNIGDIMLDVPLCEKGELLSVRVICEAI